MSTNVTGYTGEEIDGKVSMRTGQLTAITLAGGDRTLTRSEAVHGVLVVAVGHATNAIIIPAAVATEFNEGGTATILFWVRNTDASLAALIKVAGGTAVTIAATKTALVCLDVAGTNVVRLTADQ